MRLRFLLASILALTLSIPGFPDEAKSAYNRGRAAESHKKYDEAYEAYKQAQALKPHDPKYQTAFLRARAYAAAIHVGEGLKLRDNQKLQEAMAEFQRAAEIDSTNIAATQELRRTAALIKKQSEPAAAATQESPLTKKLEEAEGPVELEPSPNTPITLRMTTTADNVYRTIGKLGGVNVLFDLDYKPQRITIELNDVMMQDALRMVALESKTFWRPIASNAIFVAAEGKRKEFESNVMKTFYVHNVSTPAELQEVAGTLKSLLEINRVQVNPTHSSITVRGTPDQLVLAEKLIADNDKAKAEVMIDIAVMEVSRDRTNQLGTQVPTDTAITAVPGKTVTAGAVKFGNVNGTHWEIAIPSAKFDALMTDGHTKVLQNPQLRALNDEKATLKIGDRIPIATGSFAAGIGGGGVSPLVNTQFQYLDVGVNIDITPHIHSDHEVTLKMSLEVSTPGPQVNLGGITQPQIGQRRIEHETRLQDGEVNLVAGILQDSDTQSISGYPWLLKIPILKYLFGQEAKQRHESEIVFAITPHIVRALDVTDENERAIDVGTNNNIGLRYKESKPAKAGEASSSSSKPAKGGTRQQSSGTQGNAPANPKSSGN